MNSLRTVSQRKAEAGGVGEALPAIIIGVLVIGGCIWLALNYASSTDKEAQQFAERAVEQLAVEHDPQFLVRNLSEKGKLNCGLIRRQEMIQNFTRLGVPRRPFKITGKVAYQTEKGAKEPIGNFRTVLVYPNAQVSMDLMISRQARWVIDGIGTEWKLKELPTPTPGPSATASPEESIALPPPQP